MFPPEVTWWSTSVDRLGDSAFQILASACSASEQARAQRFVFERDRRSYLAAHGLLRHALSFRDGSRAPDEWMFTSTEHGRPELAPELASPLRFNLSHCTSRVNCVVCAEIDCGIDVEPASRGSNLERLRAQCLSQREQQWLAAGPEETESLRFIQLWTMKEAVAKGTGFGLRLPFEQLDFEIEPAPRLRSAPPGVGAHWWLAQRVSPDGHVESLALRTDAARPVRVLRREWTGTPPGAGDEPLQWRSARQQGGHPPQFHDSFNGKGT